LTLQTCAGRVAEIDGELFAVIFTPNADAPPTDGCTVELLGAHNLDVQMGLGAAPSNAVSSRVCPRIGNKETGACRSRGSCNSASRALVLAAKARFRFTTDSKAVDHRY
jgi:hypothetical protein